MFLIKITTMFVVTMLLLTSSSLYGGAKAPYIYIPSTVLYEVSGADAPTKKDVSGFLIEERNQSSSSKGIFIFFQQYRPSSTANPFNGSPNETRV